MPEEKSLMLMPVISDVKKAAAQYKKSVEETTKLQERRNKNEKDLVKFSSGIGKSFGDFNENIKNKNLLTKDLIKEYSKRASEMKKQNKFISKTTVKTFKHIGSNVLGVADSFGEFLGLGKLSEDFEKIGKVASSVSGAVGSIISFGKESSSSEENDSESSSSETSNQTGSNVLGVLDSSGEFLVLGKLSEESFSSLFSNSGGNQAEADRENQALLSKIANGNQAEADRENQALLQDQSIARKDQLQLQKKDVKNENEQTDLLSKIVNKKDDDGGGGGFGSLLAGVAMMIGAGGLLGFLMTGDTTFLHSVFKGFTKAFSIMKSGIKLFSSLAKGFVKVVIGIPKAIGGLINIVKTIQKLGFKGAAKAGGKAMATGAKSLGKKALVKIPLIGTIMSIMFAINRFKKGDIVGGLLELASGTAAIFPGIGTAISIGIDAFLLFRDFKGIGKKKEGKKKEGEGGGIFSWIWDKIKAIGMFMVKLTPEYWAVQGIKYLKDKFSSKKTNSLGQIIVDVFKNMFSSITNKVKSFFGGFGDFFSDFWENTKSKVKDSGVIGKTLINAVELIPGAEQGAIVKRPTKMVVGEKTPEMVMPLHKMSDAFREYSNTNPIQFDTSKVESENLSIQSNRESVAVNEMKSFLKKEFIPALAEEIATRQNKINKEEERKRPKTNMPVEEL